MTARETTDRTVRVPAFARGAIGRVRVERPAKIPGVKMDNAYGDYSWGAQRIRVLRELKGWTAFQVYRHEWTHMVLAEAGLQGSISDELEEVICDAVANALIREARSDSRRDRERARGRRRR